MRIKDFIFYTPAPIESMTPIRMATNGHGVRVYFYIITNSNLDILRESLFIKDFKENREVDFKYFINRWAVSIVSNGYLLNKWLSRDISYFLNGGAWTKCNVVLDGVKDWRQY